MFGVAVGGCRKQNFMLNALVLIDNREPHVAEYKEGLKASTLEFGSTNEEGKSSYHSGPFR